MNGREIDNINWLSQHAAYKGHKEIVDDMITRGANDFNAIAQFAARGGHKEIVDDMIRRGANNFDDLAQFAARRGHRSPRYLDASHPNNRGPGTKRPTT